MKKNKLSILGLSILLAGTLVAYDKKLSEDINNTKAQLETNLDKSNKIAATVNGIPIYNSKLEKLANKQLRKDIKFQSTGSSPEQIKIVKKKILEQLIMQEVLRQASIKEPVKDIDKKIEQELEVIKKEFGTIKNFKNYLPNKNMTDKEFKIYLTNKVQLNEYLKKSGVIDPHIPEERIKEFYEKNKNSFKSGDRVKVRQILLSVEQNATNETKKQVLEKANKLREMIISGKDFAKIAKEYSKSAEAVQRGGEIGIIKRGYMPKEFDKIAFSIKKGEISQPIKTQFGYHIIEVTDRQDAKVAPYKDVRDFIRKFLQEGVTSKNMESHLQKIRKEAKIEIIK